MKVNMLSVLSLSLVDNEANKYYMKFKLLLISSFCVTVYQRFFVNSGLLQITNVSQMLCCAEGT